MTFFSDGVLWVFGASSKYLMTAIFIFFHLLDRSLVLVDLMLENIGKYTRHNVKSQVPCPHLVFKTAQTFSLLGDNVDEEFRNYSSLT